MALLGVRFELTHLSIEDNESTALSHSANLAFVVDGRGLIAVYV